MTQLVLNVCQVSTEFMRWANEITRSFSSRSCFQIWHVLLRTHSPLMSFALFFYFYIQTLALPIHPLHWLAGHNPFNARREAQLGTLGKVLCNMPMQKVKKFTTGLLQELYPNNLSTWHARSSRPCEKR